MAIAVYIDTRGGSGAAAVSIVTKHSILDVAAALDPPMDTKHSLSHDNNLVPFYLW